MKRYYQHTLDNKPAYYDGTQVVFSGGRYQPLCSSLKEVRKQQRASVRQRLAWDFDADMFAMGYVVVTLPEAD